MPILYEDTKWPIFRQQDFSGGENKLYASELIAPNQVFSALNLIKTEDGLLQTRLGKTRLNTTSLGTGSIISIHRYAKENGNKYLVVQHGTSLYAVSWDGTSTISSFGTAVKTGLNAAKLRSVVWKDKLILTNGQDNVFTYDGSTCADLGGTPPKSKVIKLYAGRLWLVDIANPNYLRFSDLEDPAVWNAANLIKIRDGDGDTITTISSQSEGLLIFKTNNTWALYGTDKDTIRVTTSPVFPSIGCLSPDGMIDEGVVVGANNIYKFDLNSVGAIGDTHKKTLSVLSLEEKQQTIVVPLPKEYRVIVSLADANILNLEAVLGGITSWSGLNIQSLASCSAKDDDGALLIGDKTDGIVYKVNNEIDDAGTYITSELQTAEIDMNSPKKKVFRAFSFYLEPHTSVTRPIMAKYELDSGASQSGLTTFQENMTTIFKWNVSYWNQAVWNGSNKINDIYQLHGVRGVRLSCAIRVEDRMKFLGYWIKYREAGGL